MEPPYVTPTYPSASDITDGEIDRAALDPDQLRLRPVHGHSLGGAVSDAEPAGAIDLHIRSFYGPLLFWDSRYDRSSRRTLSMIQAGTEQMGLRSANSDPPATM